MNSSSRGRRARRYRYDEDGNNSVLESLIPDNSISGQKDDPEAGLPKSVMIRNLAAFWFLGICNNYAYCIMLSAAHDVLKEESSNATNNDSKGFLEERNCNPTSTGAILLADVIPSFVIKLVSPFILSGAYAVLFVSIAILTAIASFLVVAFSSAAWMTYLGVACASVCSGLGEVTLLRYSTQFTKNVVSTWASGTGMSGVLGSFLYASITSTGLSPRDTLLTMIVVPVIMAIMFFIVLVHPSKMKKMREELLATHANDSISGLTGPNDSSLVVQPTVPPSLPPPSLPPTAPPSLPFKTKLLLLKPLFFKYILPLALVYLAEYFINQGLLELIYFPNSSMTHDEQYRWYQVLYQVGVFISRSSVNLFKVQKLWLLPIFQFLNVIFFVFEAYYLFLPSIWIVFIFILFEGLFGGCAYVNTFYKITQEVEEPYREFSMGATSFGESMGTTTAGFISIPVHDLLCRTPIP